MEGGVDEGLSQIARGLEMQQSVGADMERPYGLGLYAEALLNAGRIEQGLAAVEEALEIIGRRARTFFWEAELHRLRGELLLELGAAADAERSLRQALATAERQEALSLQMRTALSLSRLEAAGDGARGREEAPARELVASLYGRFTEGFDTADLREARAILA
jgi:predicted ATPase